MPENQRELAGWKQTTVKTIRRSFSLAASKAVEVGEEKVNLALEASKRVLKNYQDKAGNALRGPNGATFYHAVTFGITAILFAGFFAPSDKFLPVSDSVKVFGQVFDSAVAAGAGVASISLFQDWYEKSFLPK